MLLRINDDNRPVITHQEIAVELGTAREVVSRHLKRLEGGDPVEVEHADGMTTEYVVTAVQTIDKGELPTDELFRRDGTPILTLITCGGSFSPSLNSYDSNVVAIAVPVGEATESEADSQ